MTFKPRLLPIRHQWWFCEAGAWFFCQPGKFRANEQIDRSKRCRINSGKNALLRSILRSKRTRKRSGTRNSAANQKR
ncbi:hypothetical protein KCP75_05930 [Salmonella enterica subsp. enterica]|nr:hypothetical protein KCP75_05930 [Salmonella enterica subsp. enterica]